LIEILLVLLDSAAGIGSFGDGTMAIDGRLPVVGARM